jgi:hypothetical protein
LASKFYINYAVSSVPGLFRGRRLTVGCPVVVSLLPREWSCLYRRGEPSNSFLAPSKIIRLICSLSRPYSPSGTVSRYRATAAFH